MKIREIIHDNDSKTAIALAKKMSSVMARTKAGPNDQIHALAGLVADWCVTVAPKEPEKVAAIVVQKIAEFIPEFKKWTK